MNQMYRETYQKLYENAQKFSRLFVYCHDPYQPLAQYCISQ